MSSTRLIDRVHIVSGFTPRDVDTVPTADYVSLANYNECLVLVHVGVTGASFDITLTQAKDVAGTGAKELVFTQAFIVPDVNGAGALADTWTPATVVNPGVTGSKVVTGIGDHMMIAIPVIAEMLDMDNDFRCLKVTISDPGAITFASAEYLLSGARYGGPPNVQASAVIN